MNRQLFTVYALIFALTSLNSYAQTPNTSPEPISSDAKEDTNSATTKKTLSAPDTQKQHIAQLIAQYPKTDIKKLTAEGEEFTALWRKDQSGDAFGAVLIVPTDGQTANWPNTIDVLRVDLPKNGWSTLSIDIDPAIAQRAPPRPSNDNNNPIQETTKPDNNIKRIKAAVDFLHSQGQFNIVLLGYGNSTKRVFDYASSLSPSKTQRSTRASTDTPVRALIIINPITPSLPSLDIEISSFPHKNIPVLDVILNGHFSDIDGAKTRKTQARASRYTKYLQVKLITPATNLFDAENPLSRKVRGFLNKHAKGVEIGKR